MSATIETTTEPAEELSYSEHPTFGAEDESFDDTTMRCRSHDRS